MVDVVERDDHDLQHQIDELRTAIATNTARIQRLQERAETSEVRADASQVRAEASEARADKAELRIDDIEARSQLDREMIAELQAAGVLSQEHATQLDQALRTSRTIGAAVGILMGTRQVSEEKAFDLLKQASQNNNRKVRDVAAEMVAHANAGGLIAGGMPLI